MKITKLHCQNFRLFEDLTIHFPKESNICVLIGNNGGGKSAVLDAIAKALQNYVHNLVPVDADHNQDQIDFYNDVQIGKDFYNIKIYPNPQIGSRKYLEVNAESGFISRDVPLGLGVAVNPVQTNNILPILAYYDINRTKNGKNENAKSYWHKITGSLKAYENAFSEKSFVLNDFKNWFIEEENKENADKLDQVSLYLIL